MCFHVWFEMIWPIGCIITLTAFVWLFSTVYYQMSTQSAYSRCYIVTLVAFIRFFSTVRFQMITQCACIKWCKVTLVAFVWLFPTTMFFQMFLQITCMSGCIFTNVALIWLFPTVCFQMCPKMTCLRGNIIPSVWCNMWQRTLENCACNSFLQIITVR